METPKTPEAQSQWPNLTKMSTDILGGFIAIAGMKKTAQGRKEAERKTLKLLYHMVSNPRFNEAFRRTDLPADLRANLDAIHRLQAHYFSDTLPEAEIVPEHEGKEKWLAYDPQTGEVAREVEEAERHGEQHRAAVGDVEVMLNPDDVTPDDTQ